MSKSQARDLLAELISAVECMDLPQFPELLAKAQDRPTENVEEAIVTLLAAGVGADLYEGEVW